MLEAIGIAVIRGVWVLFKRRRDNKNRHNKIKKNLYTEISGIYNELTESNSANHSDKKVRTMTDGFSGSTQYYTGILSHNSYDDVPLNEKLDHIKESLNADLNKFYDLVKSNNDCVKDLEKIMLEEIDGQNLDSEILKPNKKWPAGKQINEKQKEIMSLAEPLMEKLKSELCE